MIVVQYLRSVLFIVQMYVLMVVMAVVMFPFALIGGRGTAIWVCRTYSRWIRVSLRWFVGLRTEIRGTVPEGDVIVASKHQSFLDILLLYSALPQGKFIMKKSLLWAPFLGWYAWLIGCIPVDRARGAAAMKAMLAAVRNPRFAGGQLIIFPQGTRVAPGVRAEYKIGAGALYRTMKLPCVPAAANVGLFWPRHGLLRKPGLAVIEFLPTIEPGMDPHRFMAELEARIEPASDALMAEAGRKA
ncbi:lysophospholipid acyltransferase family protein [Paenirhodobacter enshiensis]|uniref:Glycerol acyltransferase n=1 Tax=Paenirhodobacter enshiensis TaxID=1105367 RepID=A0A086XSC8_9RHOB|nr:glycerol acyltransferase [Paenirhodobacter enshiensis]